MGGWQEFERDHPRDVQRLDRVAVHPAEQQQHQGAVAAYELGDLPEVGIPLGAPQHARRGVLPWRWLPRAGAPQHDLQPEHDRTIPSRFGGAPCLEAPGDPRHALTGQRASWAMVESAASAYLRDRRALWRGPAEVCRRWCSLRSLPWSSARVLGDRSSEVLRPHLWTHGNDQEALSVLSQSRVATGFE